MKAPIHQLNKQSFICKHSLQIGAFLAFTLFILLLSSTSVIMLHNTPLNKVTSTSEDDVWKNAKSTLDKENKRPGITFGEVDRPVHQQTETALARIIISPLFLILIILLSSIVLLPLLFFKGSLLNFFLPAVFYFVGMLSLLCIHPNIRFMTYGFQQESILWNITDNLVGHFWILLTFQSVIVGTIPLVWSQPIMPRYYNKYISSDDLTQVHIQNWRKYGSWLATIFGGILLTSALVYLENVSSFGSLFLQHVLIAIGGALLLNLVYVIHKLRRIEYEIATL